MSVPRFAIVGHPNKGKSSIVATLAEDDAVAISPHPGTTTQARAYPMRLDGETLYELVDTPGFQRARETLAWLEAHDRGAGERATVVGDASGMHLVVRFDSGAVAARAAARCQSLAALRQPARP